MPVSPHHATHRIAVAVLLALGLGGLAAAPGTAAPGREGQEGPSSAPLRAAEDIPDQLDPRAADPNAAGVDQFIIAYERGEGRTRDGRARAWGPAARAAGVAVRELRSTATGAYVISTEERLDDARAAAFMARIEASGAVEHVEPDLMMTVALDPSDARYGELWGLHGTNGMRVPEAWDRSTGQGSVVAVLDTGITAHPDLDANVVSGYDFVTDSAAARDGGGRDADPSDEGDWFGNGECGVPYASDSSWHGTHVAGTIAGVANTQGVVGVAPEARVQPVRVLAKCGGRTSDIADAIVWASGGSVPGVHTNPAPADVVNMSLGGNGSCGATYQAAIDGAVDRGTTVVVAAGNSSQDVSTSTPANCRDVVAVAASDQGGRLSYFSNFGAGVDVTAPGGDTRTTGGGILSTVNTGSTTPVAGGYAEYQGTSMAAPHVAGLVALMASRDASLTPSTAESALKSGSRPLPGGCTAGCGAGLVDGGAVLAALDGTTLPAPDPEPAPAPGQLLLNAGFESGATDWTTSHADAIERSTAARTGSWNAALNGWGRSTTYTVEQRVTIPSGSTASLGYHLRVGTNETTRSYAYDRLQVQVVDGSSVSTLRTHSNLEASGSYAAHTANLSSWAGRTVTVRFRGVEDSSLASLFRIDDTAVTVH